MNFQELSDMVIRGDNKGAEQWTRNALDAGVGPKEIIDKGLVLGMDVVGQRFKSSEYHMPEVLIAARAMKASMDLVRPLIAGSDIEPVGRVVLGTVQGDLHDIGKNLVAAMLEGGGFEIVDLGTDVSPQQMVAAIDEHEPDLVGLSALLTVTMPSMSRIIDAIVEAGQRDRVHVLVGGAPVNEEVAKEYGADAYADNANAAVRSALVSGLTIVCSADGRRKPELLRAVAAEADLEQRVVEVRETARELNAAILVKGHVDLVSDGERVKLNVTGNPGMTVGGTGDTLSGIVGSLLAQNTDPFEAAVAGAFINGAAGDFVHNEQGSTMVPTDVIEWIPHVLNNPMSHQKVRRPSH